MADAAASAGSSAPSTPTSQSAAARLLAPGGMMDKIKGGIANTCLTSATQTQLDNCQLQLEEARAELAAAKKARSRALCAKGRLARHMRAELLCLACAVVGPHASPSQLSRAP